MTLDINIDLTTGLPELPDDEFWRVYTNDKQSMCYSSSYRVAIMRQTHKRWPHKKVIELCSRVIWLDDGALSRLVTYDTVEKLSDLTPERILAAAERLTKNRARKKLELIEARAHESLVGDYPPNSLSK